MPCPYPREHPSHSCYLRACEDHLDIAPCGPAKSVPHALAFGTVGLSFIRAALAEKRVQALPEVRALLSPRRLAFCLRCGST